MYLACWQSQSFDSDKFCNDGGIFEYSLNGGITWNQVKDKYILMTSHNGKVKTGVINPLAGRNAWCFVEKEWVKSVVDLTFAKGKDVEFRFRLGTGIDGAAEGWYIDDILLQSCVPGVNEFNLFKPYNLVGLFLYNR